MNAEPAIPQIFNLDLRAQRRQRAVRRNNSFLLERAADDLADRLQDVNRRFTHAVIVGLPVFRKRLLDGLPLDKRPESITERDDWPMRMEMIEPFDLFVSGLTLQSMNDVPGALTSVRSKLQPDGMFVSSVLGGETLLGLKRACFAFDQARMDGVIPRVAPMINYQQAAGLLGQCGFALPVVDRDMCRVSYRNMKTLVSDLRDIGETNCLSMSRQIYPGRRFLEQLSDYYPEKTAEGKFQILFEILWMTGWAPHDSQQKPLKPGSAQVSLTEIFKKSEDEN